MKRVYLAVAAALVATLLAAGAALAATLVSQVETYEEVTPATTEIYPVTDANATPAGATQNTMRWVTSGRVFKRVDLEGSNISFAVRSRHNGVGAVTQRVFVDGALVSEVEMFPTANFYAYRANSIPISPGPHNIGVAFVGVSGTERAFVDRIDFNYTPSPPTGGFGGATCDVTVEPTEGADAKINGEQQSTVPQTFCVKSGTYTLDNEIALRDGDKLLGETGTTELIGGKGHKVNASTKFEGNGTLPNLIRPNGSNITVRWIDGSLANFLDGTPGSGSALAAGGAEDDLLLEYVDFHHNDGAGITNHEGRLLRSELSYNTTDDSAAGFIGAGSKASHESEIAYSYVHHNRANGLWCDNGCKNVPSQVNDAWYHDNVIAENGRFGIRFEEAPNLGETNAPDEIRHLAENNISWGNGYGIIPADVANNRTSAGMNSHDSLRATFRNNLFNPSSVSGYAGAIRPDSPDEHGTPLAIAFTSSGRQGDAVEPRPPQGDGLAEGNTLNGEHIDGCGVRGNVCPGYTP